MVLPTQVQVAAVALVMLAQTLLVLMAVTAAQVEQQVFQVHQ
jgi:hypothetical protein